jgi:hypothetical protein
MRTKELKFCPFCQNSELYIDSKPSNDGTITWYKIHHSATNECSVSMIDSDIDRLIKRWNTRYSLTPITADDIKKEAAFQYGFVDEIEGRIDIRSFIKGAKWASSHPSDNTEPIEALREYCIHKLSCESSIDNRNECTCGLEQTLQDLEKGTK